MKLMMKEKEITLKLTHQEVHKIKERKLVFPKKLMKRKNKNENKK